jgi:hypothetical protein
MNTKVEDVLTKLIGKTVTEVIAGGSNGSIVVLHFGSSEFCLFVKCVWRLEQVNTIITGWNESNDAVNGNMTKRIKELAGDAIKNVEVNNFYDLKLRFVSDKTLNIFCDVTTHYEPEDYDENWVICDIQSNVCYAVNKDFAIVTSVYK